MAYYAHPTDSVPYIYYAGGSNDYREMVISLVNGCDISFIDPQLYDKLLPYIDQYILKFQDRGDNSSIDRLKFCIEYIKGYPERERIAKILTKRKRDTSQKDLPFTQSQLKTEIDHLLNSGKFTKSDNSEYTLKEIEQITTEIRNRRLKCAENEEFDQADQYAYISGKLTARGESNLIKKIHTERAEDLLQKLQDAKASYANFKQRWDDIEVNFKIHTDKEIEEMIEAQKGEKSEFEKKKDQPIPPKYKKYSNEYLNLKMEEKKLVVSKRFEDAVIAQQRVRERKQQEDKMMLAQWHQRVHDDLKKLDKKHEQQLRVRQMNINRERNDIQKTKKKELTVIKNKIQFIEEQLRQIAESGYYVPKPPQEEENQETIEEPTEEEDNEQESQPAPKAVAIDDTANVTVFFTENKAIVDKEEEAEENHTVHPPGEQSGKSHRKINRKPSTTPNQEENPEEEDSNDDTNEYKNQNNEEEDSETPVEQEKVNEDAETPEEKDKVNEELEILEEKETVNGDTDIDTNEQDEQNDQELEKITEDNPQHSNNDFLENVEEESNENEQSNQENIENDENHDEIEEDNQNEDKYPVHPPSSRQTNDRNIDEEVSNDGETDVQINDTNEIKKPNQPKWKSNGISSNQYQSLPRLNMNQRNKLQRGKKTGPEAFRQRALLNKQLYCAKTLLERKEHNQKKEQREQMRKRETSQRDSS